MILRLIRARYRLQWAQVRRNVWRAAFFILVQVATLAVVVMALAGGLAAAAAARAGDAERIAGTILVAVFLNAVLGSVVLGFGTRQTFSDQMLRRYPLSRTTRFVARNVLGLCEPMWIITIAAYAACAVGFPLFGVAPAWRVAPALLLLFAATYLVTRLALTVIERLSASASGQFILFLLLNLFLLGPTLTRAFELSPAAGEALWRLAATTPPLMAAVLVSGSSVLVPLAALAAWTAVAAAAIMYIEAHPARRAGVTPGTAGPGVLDRLASVLPLHAPLAAKTFKYYLRHRGVRMNCLVAVVLGTNFAFNGIGPAAGTVPLPVLLGTTVFAGVMGTSMVDYNLFGFEGGGFRRLLLAPVTPRDALRTIALASLLIGACLSLLVIGAWSVVVPAMADPRVVALALCAAASGLFVFHGLGILTSVLAPRPVAWNAWFRNKQSGFAQFVAMGGVIVFIAALFALRGIAATGMLVQYWWVAPAIPLACGLFYAQCVASGGRLLAARRERVLSMLERGA